MSEINIDTDVELGEMTDEELHQRLGEIERARYQIADELKAVMDEFEDRGG